MREIIDKFSKRSLAKLGRNNPMWGKLKQKPTMSALHEYMHKRLIKPKHCKHCGKIKKLDLANKSHKYKRELTDWLWLCRKCHQIYDGTRPPLGPNKGKKFTEQWKNNMSIIRKGIRVSPKTEFKKGNKPWNKRTN